MNDKGWYFLCEAEKNIWLWCLSGIGLEGLRCDGIAK